MTSGGASLPTVSGKTPDDQKTKMADPVKVIKIVCDSADATSGDKKLPAYAADGAGGSAASFSWAHRYPAKLKAVLWNFTQNSAKLVLPSTALPSCLLRPSPHLLSAAIAVAVPFSARDAPFCCLCDGQVRSPSPQATRRLRLLRRVPQSSPDLPPSLSTRTAV